ncbi:MAG: carbohydrate-binding domain-containing protein [Chloroflexi bacterium]|nr:carbohydrate-binding domain-containing protein [Chloroflexota bacterium]
MKKIITSILQITLIVALAACSAASAEVTDSGTTSQVSAGSEAEIVTTDAAGSTVVSTPLSVNYSSEDLNPSTGSDSISYIQLEGDSILFEGTGATVNGNVVTITAAGVYSLSGALLDGQIVVDTQDEETVTLILNSVDITSSTSAPIFVRNADKVVLTLADGTQNFVTDGSSYIFENAETDEPNAAIFSNDDLTINGSGNGSLTVNANYNNGIATKDDLKITSGVIIVHSVNDGIKGRNYIAIKDGMITVNAGGDGLQSNNDEDATKGYILIEGGTLNIISGMDGIQAETRLTVNTGTLNISSGGGSVVNYELEESAKGLKAGMDVTITGGTFNIDSADDAIHSNSSVMINGGNILIASGDDGIHADATFTINNGEVNIAKAYEGIESAIITINGGSVRLNSSDDGVNGSDGSSSAGQPQQGMMESGNAHLYINGGYLFVDAIGDGIDINGPIDMTAGTVIVNGPVENMNSPLDYSSAFNLTGGYLLAVGSSGMAQAPSASSTQYSVQYGFESQQAAGTLVHIETESGEEILTFMPTKAYQSVVLSSPALANGSTYVIYSGGSSSGAAVDGLYSDGTYTAGTQIASFSISSMVTTAGTTGGGFPGGGPGGGRPHP